MHGGTFNDIAIHAVDFIPWVTGLSITGIDAARTWNAKASEAPDFHDCGQFMLRLSNGGGVIGDVSYLAPDSCGYSMPNYWRITVHGSRGLLEISWNSAGVTAADDDSKGFETLPSGPGRPGGYLEDFLCELKGQPRSDGITTESCFEATRLALQLESQAI
jgi:predicted dehydrogenase